MVRPYTICYLNCSADGRIDGEFFRAPESQEPTAIFRRRWLDMQADAIIYGAVTMAQFAGGMAAGPNSPWMCEREIFPKTDFVAPCRVSHYYVAVNIRGTICYDSPYIDKKGRGEHGIIHVLTEDVSDSYVAYLHRLGISYIFCGKKALEAGTMMDKLYRLFGIKKAIVSGGAYADWSLLEKGLIDEVILLLNPVVDGNPSAHPVFMRSPGMEAKAVGLELVEVEVVAGGGVFLTYRPKNTVKGFQ